MEEQAKEKPFDVVSFVLLTLIVLLGAAATFFTDLIFAVPVIGQVIFFFDKIFQFCLSAAVQAWFYLKTGQFGWAGIINMIGEFLEEVGVPGASLVTLWIAMWIANNPKLAAIAQVAAGAAVTGGAGAAVAGTEAAAAGGKAAAVGGEAAAAGKEAAGVEKAAVREGRGGAGAVQPKEPAPSEAPGARPSEKPPAETPETEKPPQPEISKEALGEEPTPLEKLEKLFKEIPAPEAKKDEDEKELPKAA